MAKWEYNQFTCHYSELMNKLEELDRLGWEVVSVTVFSYIWVISFLENKYQVKEYAITVRRPATT